MKNILYSIVLSALIQPVFGQICEPTTAELTAKYNTSTKKVEVLANFDANGKLFTGISMISLVLEEKAQNIPLVIQSASGMVWSDQSQSYGQKGSDYHAIISTGAGNIAYDSQSPLKLFEFALPEGLQIEDVKFWNIEKHIKTSSDGTDYISNFYFPHKGYYVIPTIKEELSTDNEEVAASELFKAKLFPNPCINQTVLTFQTSQAGEYNIQLFDMTGALLQQSKLSVQANDKVEHTIGTSQLESGAYQCVIQNQQKQHLKTLSFIKIND